MTELNGEIDKSMIIFKDNWFKEQTETSIRIQLWNIINGAHPTTVGLTFFSSSHGMLNKVDHMLSHKTSNFYGPES